MNACYMSRYNCPSMHTILYSTLPDLTGFNSNHLSSKETYVLTAKWLNCSFQKVEKLWFHENLHMKEIKQNSIWKVKIIKHVFTLSLLSVYHKHITSASGASHWFSHDGTRKRAVWSLIYLLVAVCPVLALVQNSHNIVDCLLSPTPAVLTHWQLGMASGGNLGRTKSPVVR